jgi:hypothetical protein
MRATKPWLPQSPTVDPTPFTRIERKRIRSSNRTMASFSIGQSRLPHDLTRTARLTGTEPQPAASIRGGIVDKELNRPSDNLKVEPHRPLFDIRRKAERPRHNAAASCDGPASLDEPARHKHGECSSSIFSLVQPSFQIYAVKVMFLAHAQFDAQFDLLKFETIAPARHRRPRMRRSRSLVFAN